MDNETLHQGALVPQGRVVFTGKASNTLYPELLDALADGRQICVLGDDVPRTDDQQKMNEGEFAFTLVDEPVVGDQTINVFTNLSAVAVSGGPNTSEEDKRRQIRKRIRLMGPVDNPIEFSGNRPKGGGEIAIQIQGNRGILNTGPKTIKAGELIMVRVPEVTEKNTGKRHPGETIGVTPDSLRKDGGELDFSSIAHTRAFRSLVESVAFATCVMIQAADGPTLDDLERVELPRFYEGAEIEGETDAAKTARNEAINTMRAQGRLLTRVLCQKFKDDPHSKHLKEIGIASYVVGGALLTDQASFIGGVALQDIKKAQIGDAMLIHAAASLMSRLV